MILFLIVFSVIAAILLIPSQLAGSSKALQKVDDSLQVRLAQLKQEFQFRSKELARRLESGDLAESEWSQLSKELEMDTAASLAATQQATLNKKTHPQYVTTFILISLVCAVAALSYRFSNSFELARHQANIVEQLKQDPQYITKLSEIADKEKSEQSLEDLFMALRAQIDIRPNDANAWRALAMFNLQVGRNDDAVQSIQQAVRLAPANLDVQVEMAQIFAGTRDAAHMQYASRLLQRVLSQQPEHQGALLTYGFNAFAMGEYQQAIEAWQKLLKLRSPDSEAAKMLQRSIVVAQQKLDEGSQVTSTNPVAKDEQVVSANAGAVDGQVQGLKVAVSIPDNIRQQLSGAETVFVFAKAVSGPPMPLAVVKTPLKQLPSEISLSDANAMQPQLKMSGFDQVKVVVRVSKRGNPIAASGDFEGYSAVIAAPYQGQAVTVTVDQQIN